MSKTTKTETENKPPEWAKPLFEAGASEAMNLHNSGSGGNTYMGSTVADLSGTTQQGINALTAAGQNWDTASGTRGQFQQIGQQAMSDPSVNALMNLAGGVTAGRTDMSGLTAGNVGTQDYAGILQRAMGPSSASQNLQGYASGEYLQGEGNPFYRERLDKEIADSNAMIRSQMSGMGRYGSDVAGRAVADNTSNMLLSGLEQDFNRQTQNQFNAVNMIDAANNAALQNQLGAAGGIAGIGASNADRALQAGIAQAGYSAGDQDRALQAQNLQGNLLSQAGALRGEGYDRGLAATNAMAGLDQQNFQNQLTGAQAQISAGQLLDQQAQAQLNDQVAQWYAKDNEDWTKLNMLLGAAAGSAGNYGVQNQTSRQPVNVWGALGSLFGKSDIRLKENIVAVGRANGITIYEWNYLDQPDRWRGVIAQSLPLGSDAAVLEADGFYAVDYSRLGLRMEAVR